MIYYKKRRHYKYTLYADYQHQTQFHPAQPISTSFIELDTGGMLTIKKKYAWDGPSGPTIDTDNFMRGLTCSRRSLPINAGTIHPLGLPRTRRPTTERYMR